MTLFLNFLLCIPENSCEECRYFSVGFLFLPFFFWLLVFYIFILQIEPILSGNLPPGFDSSTCRSV
jgi:hypothetical protein